MHVYILYIYIYIYIYTHRPKTCSTPKRVGLAHNEPGPWSLPQSTVIHHHLPASIIMPTSPNKNNVGIARINHPFLMVMNGGWWFMALPYQHIWKSRQNFFIRALTTFHGQHSHRPVLLEPGYCLINFRTSQARRHFAAMAEPKKPVKDEDKLTTTRRIHGKMAWNKVRVARVASRLSHRGLRDV